jgi:cell division protein FtsN
MGASRTRALFLAIALAVAAGCAAQRQSVPPPNLPTSMPSEEEARRVKPGAGEAIGRAPTDAVYRVQLLATADGALAERRAAAYAAELGVGARIDVEGDLFKVRLGGYARREEAEELQARARARGHAEAFVVETHESAR